MNCIGRSCAVLAVLVLLLPFMLFMESRKVVEKGSGELIGQCGITYQEYNGGWVPEVGYLFRKEFWHKGFATEAAIACKEYAFQVLDFDDVYSIIRDSNVASQNVARRNGMSEVDILIKYYRGVEMPHIVFRASRKNI